MVGNRPSGPEHVGVIECLSNCQSFETIPCCAGPAPITIDAQLGLLFVGMTARACMVHAPLFISAWICGAFATLRAEGLRPSTPTTTKRLAPASTEAPNSGSQTTPSIKLLRN